MNTYTEEQKKEIVNNYAGGSYKAYAESVGISRSTFSKWRKQYSTLASDNIMIVDITNNVKQIESATSNSISLTINNITITLNDNYNEALLLKVLGSIKKL